MNVQPIDSLTRTTESLYTQESPDSVTQEDFLQMLITQLEYQDPLDPQDPAEFTSQLTQFSNLEQLMGINDSIEALQMLQASTNNTMAAALIGREVVYEGNTTSVSGGEAENLHFHTQVPAREAVVSVYDDSNRLVRSIRLDGAPTGTNTVQWDAVDDYGVALPDGEYRFEVSGTDMEGNTIAMTPLTVGHASGLIFDDGVTYLDVEGVHIPISEVYSVYE